MNNGCKAARRRGRSRVLNAINLVALVCLVPMMACGPASDPFPLRRIEFIVPWGPGGGSDLLSSELVRQLEDSHGWQVNIIYETGAGGARGHELIASSPPDGYTLGAVTPEVLLMSGAGLTDVGPEEFTPLCLLGLNPAVVAVEASLPLRNLRDLERRLAAYPGSLSAGGTSRGGLWDLARQGYLQESGLAPDALRWKGSDGAATACEYLVRGELDVLFVGVAEALDLASKEKIRVLGVMAEERSKHLPEVPTLRELGLTIDMHGWVIVAAPAGLPNIARQELLGTLESVTSSGEFQEKVSSLGFVLKVSCGDDLSVFLEDEHERLMRFHRASEEL